MYHDTPKLNERVYWKKRKQSQRSGSSGSEPSPLQKKQQTTPVRPVVSRREQPAMGESENRIVSKLEVKFNQKIKQMKDETVQELKKILDTKFLELDVKMKKQIQDVEDRWEAKFFAQQNIVDEQREAVAQLQRDNNEMKAEMRCIKAELNNVKNHAVSLV